MRQHLYRARRIDNGHWVEGYYCVFGDSHQIYEECEPYEIGSATLTGKWHKINPFTLQQFTGKLSASGLELFEGHIVDVCYADWIKPESGDKADWEAAERLAKRGIIMWSESKCGFGVLIGTDFCPLDVGVGGYIEVVGVVEGPETITLC